jgi:hypothetical protein
MPRNEHFHTIATWEEARTLLEFEPRRPRDTAGRRLQSLHVHIRDHKRRELAPEARTLEAHYGTFVVSQAQPGPEAARKRAIETSYGQTMREGEIAGHEARVYELGPEPPPNDIDGRSPAVVTWPDGPLFFLVASGELAASALERIARSMYDG